MNFRPANTPDIAAGNANDTPELPVADTTQNEAPQPGASPQQAKEPGQEPKPKSDRPELYPDPRIEIARRQREARKASDAAMSGNVAPPADPNAPEILAATPDVAREQPEQEPPAQQDQSPPQPEKAAEQPVRPEMFKVKIRGAEYSVSRDDLIKMAGLTPEESNDLPISVLIRSAQITEATKSYLAEAREEHKNTPWPAGRDEAVPLAHERGQPPANRTDAAATQRKPDTKALLVEKVEKLQFGDSEEAAEALDAAFNTMMEQREAKKRIEDSAAAVDASVDDFFKSNEEFKSPILTRFLFSEATDVIAQEVATAIGIEPSQARAFIGNNPQIAAQAYNETVAAGLKVPTPGEILAKAAASVRDAIGKPPTVVTPSPSTAQSTPAIAQRIEEKRAIPTTMQRSPAPGLPQPAAPRSSTSSAIERMRRIYGHGS